MRKLLIVLMGLTSFAAMAQPDDDKDVTFYEDSEVKHSRFMLALNLDPNFTDRRLINSEIPNGGDFTLNNANAKGSFQLNYGVDAFYRIGSSLAVGVGVGRATSSYTVEDAIYHGTSGIDSIPVNIESKVGMYTLPIKMNFSTALSDIFDLEVVPQVQMNFISDYENSIIPLNGGNIVTEDRSDETQNVTFSVGLGLGGTFKFSDNWGLFVRGEVKYMLSPMIDERGYPRETLLSGGLNLGLKYSF